MKSCSFSSCDRPHLAKGWCSAHYQQVIAGKAPCPIRDRKGIHERLWDRVDKTENCWLWKGAVNDRGYGLIGAGKKGKLRYVHRVSYEKHNGPIEAGKEVCHSCDTPHCVNPAHLFLGTHRENMEDMARKGRANRTLTEEQVREVMRLRLAKVPRREIVERTGIRLGTLKDILKGKNWTHVTGGRI